MTVTPEASVQHGGRARALSCNGESRRPVYDFLLRLSYSPSDDAFSGSRRGTQDGLSPVAQWHSGRQARQGSRGKCGSVPNDWLQMLNIRTVTVSVCTKHSIRGLYLGRGTAGGTLPPFGSIMVASQHLIPTAFEMLLH